MSNNSNQEKANLREKTLHGALKSLESFPINRLNDIISKSEEEKREYGFVFCGSVDLPPFGDVSHSELCTGTECSIDIIDCQDKKPIGSFHTHPHVKNAKDFGNLSPADIYGTVTHGHSFSCIGLIENNKPTINCFTPIFDIDQHILADVYKSQSDYGRTLSKMKRQIVPGNVDELIASYDKMIIAEKDLLEESKALSKKLLSKKADLIVRR